MKFSEAAAEPGYAARGPGERPLGVEPLPVKGDPASTDSGESWEEPVVNRSFKGPLGGWRQGRARGLAVQAAEESGMAGPAVSPGGAGEVQAAGSRTIRITAVAQREH
jgi:hypothetical protein